MSSLIGKTLGQYEIVELLGQGGMAKVYKGYQASVGRHVAIKVLPPHPGLDEQFKERFELEAKTIGGLQNPNILPLYDFGTEGDVVYLAMAYVEGGTLEDIIDSGPMDIRDVERILRSVASGLDYAHKRGVIHRDIKPANILMSDGHPLLADFGLVKMMASGGNLTGTAIIGTPSYMAPEQGQGLEVDERVDIYALGVMAYEMLTGKQPYTGSTPMQIIFKHINDPVPDVLEERPDLPIEVADVIERAMIKEPEFRYETAGEFAEAFTSAIHQDTTSINAVRKAFPIETEQSTRRYEESPNATVNLTNPNLNPNSNPPTNPGAGSQTIIVQHTANPFILLGGFGLIAIVIVVVAIVLITQNNNTASPTAIAEVIASPTTASTSAPTQIVPQIDSKGDVFFSSVDAVGDGVTLSVNELIQPPDNTQYVAWLMNTETSEWLFLDRLIVDSFGRGNLTFVDDEGRILPVHYNALVITAENEVDETPDGDIVYNAEVLPSVSNALQQILISSENGIENPDGTFGSLLDGAVAEAGFAQQHAGLAANSTDLGGLQTHSEHTINILNGTQEDYNGNGRGENPGRGIGLFFFVDTMRALLDEAVTQEDATIGLQVNAENIRVCLENTRRWANEVIELETLNFTAESVEAVSDEQARATELVGFIITGFDANSDGRISEFEGECGLEQIPGFALEASRMNLIEGDMS